MSSPADTEAVMTCGECGASILQTHLQRGLAGMWAGRMLCPPCLREHKQADPTTAAIEAELGGSRVMPGMKGEAVHDPPSYKRSMNTTGEGATRIRTFHSKLSENAITHLDQQVNAWLDSRPGVEVKFATTAVGSYESGQHAEPMLILTLFY